MNITRKFTYLMYLIEDNDNTIFLGICSDPEKLYYNSLNFELVNNNKKHYLLKWLHLFETYLDDQEKKDLEYAFMYNPEIEFSYKIKNMQLVIKKISQF
jgi:hypothetical protein